MKTAAGAIVIAALLGVTEGARKSRKGAQAATSDSATSIAGVPVHDFKEGVTEWIVQFQPETTNEMIHDLCGDSCTLEGHPDEGGVAFAKIEGDIAVLEQLMNKRAGIVEHLEPDGTVYASSDAEETDEASAASWGLERVGVAGRRTQGRGVHIYVQDTGVRTSHRDFGGRAVPQLDLTSGRPVVCSSSSSSCARDRQGHGTHCAGTAGGTSYGVASRARVYGVKTLSDSGSGSSSWQISALDWMASNRRMPAVASLSLGGSGASSSQSNAVSRATSRGVVVVVAAGNENSDACGYSPAFAPKAITVGATTSSNARASYSNFGRCLNIMAPGSSIRSAGVGSDTSSTSLSGTSMACPHVSGAAALLLESSPSLGRDGVLSRLLSRARRGYISRLKSNDPDRFLRVD